MSTKLSRLDNGIIVLTDTIPHVESVFIGGWFDRGTMHERPGKSGVAHLNEHMVHKGTKKRTFDQITEAIENVGGSLNAMTSEEETAYVYSVLAADSELAVDIMADIILNPIYPQEELEKERQVVAQEISQYNDQPHHVALVNCHETMFDGHPVGRSILGDVDTVLGLTREDLIEFTQENYGSENFVVAASGKIEHDYFVAMVRDRFSGMKPVKDMSFMPPIARPDFILEDRPQLEQLAIVIGFPSVSVKDPDLYATTVMNSILGGGFTSRLFMEIRERRGLVYDVGSSHWPGYTTGAIHISGGLAPENAPQFFEAAMTQMKNLKDDVTDKEIERAKNQLCAKILMGMESTSLRAQRLPHSYRAHGYVRPVEDAIRDIRKVTARAVKDAIERTLAGPMVVSVVGDTTHIPSHDDIKGLLH
jgi:predicted Zn-dependent peptidase